MLRRPSLPPCLSRSLQLFFTLGALWGCPGEPIARTQLVLACATDIPSAEVISFTIVSPDGRSQVVQGPATGETRTLTLLRETAVQGKFTLTAAAYAGGKLVVQREAVAAFVSNQTRVVPLHLLARCIDVRCPEGETCAEQGCRRRDLAPEELETWEGKAPSLPPAREDAGSGPFDAGLSPRDGSVGTPKPALDAAVIANAGEGGLALDGDAGGPGSVGSTQCTDGVFDLGNDVAHCGFCTRACQVSNAARHFVAQCVEGQCKYLCEPGFADCDAKPITGCETDLSTKNDCGRCGNKCPGSQKCNAGVCS